MFSPRHGLGCRRFGVALVLAGLILGAMPGVGVGADPETIVLEPYYPTALDDYADIAFKAILDSITKIQVERIKHGEGDKERAHDMVQHLTGQAHELAMQRDAQAGAQQLAAIEPQNGVESQQ